MRIKKTLVVAALSITAITALTISTAYAYFSDKDDIVNKVSIGKNDISISENFSTPDSITPGDNIVKEPVIEVSGTDCYVRVFCEFSDSSINYATLNFNTSDWTEKQADGYYYYKHKLSDGEKTTPLFTRVKIDDSIDDAQLDKDFDIIIYSESAQAYDTYAHKDFADYKEAWKFWEQRRAN